MSNFFPTRLACGWKHTIICSDLGAFYGFGQSKNGEISQSSAMDEFPASDIKPSFPDPRNVESIMVCVGAQHTVYLVDGKVYTSGSNQKGRLGHNSSHGQVQFPDKDTIKWIACGCDSTIALSQDGVTMYFWGINFDNAVVAAPLMTKLPTMGAKIEMVACGAKHNLALCTDGSVWAWGEGKNGRLGMGSDESTSTPTCVETLVFSYDQRIVQVACGEAHSMALSMDGLVYVWGTGSYGRLGTGSEDDVALPTVLDSLAKQYVLAVSCDAYHSLCVTAPEDTGDYSLFTWGGGKYGKLGHGSEENCSTPKPIEIFKKPVRVVRAACGQHHTVAMTADNRVWVWGYALNMRLGMKNTSVSVTAPMKLEFFDSKKVCPAIQEGEGSGREKIDYKVTGMAAGTSHSLVMANVGNTGRMAALTWGSNRNGQLGVGKMANSPKPIALALNDVKKIKAVACGQNFCVLLTDAKAIYSWGENNKGQLGQGDTAQRDRPAMVKALQGTLIDRIACGFNHCAAISNMSSFSSRDCIYMWGDNQYGQLGLGDNGGAYEAFPKSLPKLNAREVDDADDKEAKKEYFHMEVALGGTHTLVLVHQWENNSGSKTLGTMLYACGTGENGQLGLSGYKVTDKVSTPTRVLDWILHPEDSGGAKVPMVKMIVAGEKSSVAVSAEFEIHKVYVWGCHEGIQSIADPLKILQPTYVRDLAEEGWLGKKLDPNGAGIINDMAILQVVAGSNHHMIIAQYNTASNKGRPNIVFGWGSTQFGKMGIGNVTLFMKERKALKGNRSEGDDEKKGDDQDDDNPVLPLEYLSKLKEKRLVNVSCKSDHVLAINQESEVLIWGYGDAGRLGLADGSGKSSNKSELEPVVIPLFHKAERQQIMMQKLKTKEQEGKAALEEMKLEETKPKKKVTKKDATQVGSNLGVLTEGELRQYFSAQYTDFIKGKKELLRQFELVHAAILRRIKDSQGWSGSLTARYFMHEQALFRRQMAAERLEAAATGLLEVKDSRDDAAEMGKVLMDHFDSGEYFVNCFNTDEEEWNADVDVMSVGDFENTGENPENVYKMMKEERSKVSFEKDTLTTVEVMLTRFYTKPCYLLRAFEEHQLKMKDEENKVIEAKVAEESGKNVSTNVNLVQECAERIMKYRATFVNLVFSIYDMFREEDIRIFSVFLRRMFEETTKNRSTSNLISEHSLEWAVFKEIAMQGTIRRQLADLMADILGQVKGQFEGAGDSKDGPCEWLQDYAKTKQRQRVDDALNAIAKKADELFALLHLRDTFNQIIQIVQWPLVIMFKAMRRNKVETEIVIGRVVMRLLVEVILMDQTYQFQRKRAMEMRIAYGHEAANKKKDPVGAHSRNQPLLDNLRSSDVTAKRGIEKLTTSGASKLGSAETLVILRLKDMVTAQDPDVLSDMLFYVSSKYKVPQWILKEYTRVSQMKQSPLMNQQLERWNKTIVEIEKQKAKSQGSSTDKSILDLLTDSLEITTNFPRRVCQIPRNSISLVMLPTFSKMHDPNKMKQEVGVPSGTDNEKFLSDFKRVNMRIDPSRCDFELRRRAADKPCMRCGCMHTKDAGDGASGESGAVVGKDGVLIVTETFSDTETTLMLECLDTDMFYNFIQEFSGDACWNFIFGGLATWRQLRMDEYSAEDGHHHYELLKYALSRMAKVKKGTTVHLGEELRQTFLSDENQVEPSVLVENLKIRAQQMKERKALKEMTKDALLAVCKSFIRTNEVLRDATKEMEQDFGEVQKATDPQKKVMDLGIEEDEANGFGRSAFQELQSKIACVEEVNIVKERGRALRCSYEELVNEGILYRVKPLRKFANMTMCFLCLRCWTACHCMDDHARSLINFLTDASFIFITTTDPNVVEFRLGYSKSFLDPNVVILRSMKMHLSVLSAGGEACKCHKLRYSPVGDDVPLNPNRKLQFQFSKSNLFRFLQKMPRNIADEGAADMAVENVI